MKKIILSISMFLFFFTVANSYSATYTYWSPEQNIAKVDIFWLNKALNSPYKVIYIAMYSFTDKQIAKDLVYLANHGVKIYIYRDDKQMQDKTDVTWMIRNNRNIFIKAKRDKGFWNIMHDKIFIIPGIVFREGSANWSPSAEGASCYNGNCGHSENQDNNATYITDEPQISQAINIFKRIWNRQNNINVN